MGEVVLAVALEARYQRYRWLDARLQSTFALGRVEWFDSVVALSRSGRWRDAVLAAPEGSEP